jgi:predicted NUDIX family NTP pyrophosphohydrolase
MTRKSEISAGLLVFRRKPGVEVLLGHPGGPYWARKDAGAWSIPKGLVGPDGNLVAK